MAIKKSELYSSLWASCDELRGGMDASQYKDYVLVMLFIKYVSDKYAGQPYAPIAIPDGASFADMVALKGTSDIGDQINKKIIGPLANANKLSDMPDFNDATKLGTGKEMVDRLSNLIAIFENPALDFSKNRADGDDILGDAYEYLMRHFATESGKSKGQFYTPAEVSRIMAKILGIGTADTSNDTTVYDPTCGSGSLLLKVGDEARAEVTLYGQEKDAATSGLARMNMILHDYPTALIAQGNTLTDPKFRSGEALKTFDYVVANPPFSDKRWSNGLDPLNDPFGRFEAFGVPPAKQGDYAYLLHIIRSLKSNGKGACILPHGVLFRGNAEADIRRNLIKRGYIKGIIGLPANLFYGTGIPACIVVIDKEDAQARKGIFMVDASQGFMKDGPKNRLREQDLHKIVDVFTRQDDSDPKYARMVGFDEIEKNDYNLNLPRYIDSTQSEDLQDIEGHLKGGIPERDVDALATYWAVCPALKSALFSPLPPGEEQGGVTGVSGSMLPAGEAAAQCNGPRALQERGVVTGSARPGYLHLAVDKSAIKATIYAHPEFAAFLAGMNAHFAQWRDETAAVLKTLQPGFHPKQLIEQMAESLLSWYWGKPLVDAYDIYQHLMDYWAETMQDDAYLIAAEGWQAKTYRIIEKTKQGKEKDKGWACDLLPKPYIVAEYFAAEAAAIDALNTQLEAASSALTELEEEHAGDDDVFAGFDRINAAAVKDRIREIRDNGEEQTAAEELAILRQWQKLADEESRLKKAIREADVALDAKAYAQYPKLLEDAIKTLVVERKWLAALEAMIQAEMDRVSQSLTQRIKELAERYESPLPQLTARVEDLETRVAAHLEKMGFAWK